MFKLKTLTVKNFMSVGNATQTIDFDRHDLTLVLGENLDLGGDGSRNGTGKTSLLNAISYALYGSAVSSIRKDNLVNRTNSKNMLVSLDFSINGQDYRVERGRKPNVLRFFVDNQECSNTEDQAQGDSRETQEVIERLLGMSHDMFRHILALNTYTDPFLSLKSNEQRTIIEQLLGITQLSERAERIKELNRVTKEAIQQEEFRIRAVQEANTRIEEQINSLKKRQTLWLRKRQEDCATLSQAILDLEHIDIDTEIQSHRDLELFFVKKTAIEQLQQQIRQAAAEQAKLTKECSRLRKELQAVEEHRCYACGQDIHDNKQDEIQQKKQAALDEITVAQQSNADVQADLAKELDQLGNLGTAPTVFYDTLEAALNHRNSLASLQQGLTARSVEADPYDDQIVEMQQKALQTVNYDALNEYTRVQEHQEFLLKLLTSKDSFIRKKIIDQNLSYLNSRLTYYLEHIGLPHTVKFQNDLSVGIEELGRELDFDNLSRGERNRLILSMSWAFRDVWESLYHPINLLFIDELIDNGLDTSGVESALALLKQMSRDRHKSVWLVSHRDELVGRVQNILKVIKLGGFTEFSTDCETR